MLPPDDKVIKFPSRGRKLNGVTLLENALAEATDSDEVVIMTKKKNGELTFWSTKMSEETFCHMARKFDSLCHQLVIGVIDFED